MSNLFTYCFDKWWRPMLFLGFTIGLVVLGEFISNRLLGDIGFSLLAVGLLALIISAIYQLTKRRWLQAIVTILAVVGTIAGLLIYSVVIFFIETLDGDKWADNLKIPPNIQLDTPIDLLNDDKDQTAFWH